MAGRRAELVEEVLVITGSWPLFAPLEDLPARDAPRQCRIAATASPPADGDAHQPAHFLASARPPRRGAHALPEKLRCVAPLEAASACACVCVG